MDCLTAQTKITSYVEKELADEDLKEFLLHMEKCSSCREELEIYYTLLEATRQLDEGVLTTNNFSLELEQKIKQELELIRGKESRKAQSQFIGLCLVFACIIWILWKLI